VADFFLNGRTLMSESSTARIRDLNDAFRKTFAGGKMVMSASVAALPEMVKASALIKVAEFTDFTPEAALLPQIY
jgi:hypothetical protein